MTTLLDNKAGKTVGKALADHIQPKARLSVAANRFSVYGYAALKKQLDRIVGLRLLLPTGVPGSPEVVSMKALAGNEAERRFRNTLNLPFVARQCAAWLEKKTKMRAVSQPIPQNLYHVENPDGRSIAVHGSSPLTSDGLGVVPSESFEMNTLFSTPAETESLRGWFDAIWNGPGISKSIQSAVLKLLKQIGSDHPPERMYFFTLSRLFEGFLDEITEEKIIKTRTGIRDTLTWSKLYQFQRDGVLGAIDKLERHSGCIIADSVGLGKTFEALAIIKYYELRNDRVLVLCPKKLRENWTIFTVNDKRNIFEGDRFNYDVLNHTDLSRVQGKSGEIDLATLNWGNYDLLVIDESHNFRNNNPRKDGLTRYGRLMRDIIRSGVKTKVLMLSATPVNNRMNDLKNQAAFITEGNDLALADAGIASIEQTLKLAQTRFNEWLKGEDEQRTTASLLEALNFDYFKLLDLLTIARSRKHIQKYYNIAEIGAFPERAKPINIKTGIDDRDEFPPLEEINREIRRLNLSAYAPLKYVLPEKMPKYSRKYDRQVSGGSVFKQMDREESLIHLMRVNLFKRMESGINSFALTIEKLLAHVHDLIERIETHDEMDVEELNIEDIEIEAEEFAPLLIGRKVKVLIQDMDRIRWKQELEEDEKRLRSLLETARAVDENRDQKLARLKKVIAEKVRNPINAGNRKILVFTAFADTANYLYRELATWAKKTLGIHTALVTGRTGDNKTTLPKVGKELWAILTAFSPIAKERAKIDPAATAEIDLLIATDCISEGQNLQDCDYLVNYDIHWNPVRIIQRFGRIDRLGSRNKVIQLVNFWPNMELDEYINLEARVSGRMMLLDISATGEENVIELEGSRMNDLPYRRRQLEQLQNEVVDIEDLNNGISITDLTLNDFRMDLGGYLKEHPAEDLDALPPGLFAVAGAENGEETPPGAIFCLRCVTDRVSADGSNPLAPYDLVYVSDDGDVLLNYAQAKKALDRFKRLARGKTAPAPSAAAAFRKRTKDGADMGHYRELLARAVEAVTGKAEEKGVESLFQRGGTALTADSFRGIDDFEVVTFLAIVEDDAA